MLQAGRLMSVKAGGNSSFADVSLAKIRSFALPVEDWIVGGKWLTLVQKYTNFSLFQFI